VATQAKTKKLTKKQKKQNNTWIWVTAVIAVVVLAALAWVFANQGEQPAAVAGGLPAEISVDQAYELYQDGTFVLDVRTQEEWDEYHAPGTTLIPLDQLPNRLSELPSDQPIVVICRSGNRSQEGRNILQQAGFEDVTSVAGGLSGWRAAGYPVEP
jgi:rhodanese-related sulfurtransferase